MKFIVPGRIRGKGRPRFARHGKFVRTFTDDKTLASEATVKHFAAEAMKGRSLFEGPLWMSIAVYLIPPASWSRTKRAQAKYVTGKPDCDNILKLCADAMNGTVYTDDSQLSEVALHRRYTLDGPERVEIEIGQCAAVAA